MRPSSSIVNEKSPGQHRLIGVEMARLTGAVQWRVKTYPAIYRFTKPANAGHSRRSQMQARSFSHTLRGPVQIRSFAQRGYVATEFEGSRSGYHRGANREAPRPDTGSKGVKRWSLWVATSITLTLACALCHQLAFLRARRHRLVDHLRPCQPLRMSHQEGEVGCSFS